jgi:hypothetical protein
MSVVLKQDARQQEQAGAGVDQPLPDRILLEHVDGQLLLDVDDLAVGGPGAGPARRPGGSATRPAAARAAERLEPYIGTRRSKGTFSAAERSIAGTRVRQFTAGDLIAFLLAFNLPLAWRVTGVVDVCEMHCPGVGAIGAQAPRRRRRGRWETAPRMGRGQDLQPERIPSRGGQQPSLRRSRRGRKC